MFFEEAIAAAKKHFYKEWLGRLIHFVVAGESKTSEAFCEWLTGSTTSFDGTFTSEVHKTDINLYEMITYFLSGQILMQPCTNLL
mmetsp:Transcript_9147/g.14064  ORF Transcript_9147/g.14064 Transcript_9147/m.14064 type:complete len:85 (-) Transcript_9147:1518-1772(-)